MVLTDTTRRRIYNRAFDRYGYIATHDAEQRGGLDHVAYGLYRFEKVPRTGRDQYIEAVLHVAPNAYLTQDAVLAPHDLGLVNLRRIRVGSPSRERSRLPDYIEIVHPRLDPEDLTTYEGIPTATVARALLDSPGLTTVNASLTQHRKPPDAVCSPRAKRTVSSPSSGPRSERERYSERASDYDLGRVRGNRSRFGHSYRNSDIALEQHL